MGYRRGKNCIENDWKWKNTTPLHQAGLSSAASTMTCTTLAKMALIVKLQSNSTLCNFSLSAGFPILKEKNGTDKIICQNVMKYTHTDPPWVNGTVIYTMKHVSVIRRHIICKQQFTITNISPWCLNMTPF